MLLNWRKRCRVEVVKEGIFLSLDLEFPGQFQLTGQIMNASWKEVLGLFHTQFQYRTKTQRRPFFLDKSFKDGSSSKQPVSITCDNVIKRINHLAIGREAYSVLILDPSIWYQCRAKSKNAFFYFGLVISFLPSFFFAKGTAVANVCVHLYDTCEESGYHKHLILYWLNPSLSVKRQ